MFEKLIAQLNAQREAHTAKIEALRTEGTALAGREQMTAEERTRAMAIVTELAEARAAVTAIGAQLDQVRAEQAADQRATDAAQQRIIVGDSPQVRVIAEPNPVYRKGDYSTSYFRDLFTAGQGGFEGDAARVRLTESQQRAATSAAGAGGELAPPLWLVEDFVALARAGRVTADQVNGRPLPDGVASINIPKVTGNTEPAVTQTQNTTITEGSFTTTSVSSGITEISGKQTVPIALLRQSGAPIDEIILSDLAAAYAVTLDVQVISGSNANGQLRGLITAGTTVTYTTGSPAVVSTTVAASFYSKVLGAMGAVSAGRKLPADKIIMTSTRWNWVLAALDGQNRPLVIPNGPAFNQAAETGAPTAEGASGTLLGLPVFTDPNIPANLGVATNQDVVFVLRSSDLWLWESEVESASFDATLAAQNSILFRVLGFAAFIPHRHQASVQIISGTGLVAPTF